MEKLTSYDQEIQQKMATHASSVTNRNQNHAKIHQLDQEAANTSNSGNGNQHREFVISIKEMAESCLELPLSSNACCIYRIPTFLRKLNEEAYTPQVISIGPFHHGTKRLEPMEKLKLKYFQRFLQQIEDFNVLEILVNAIKLNEERVRSCYAETINLSSDDFVRLILVDGIFIIEFFYGIWFKGLDRVIRENHILLNPISWQAIMSDLRLLENQLPFFALEILFSLACAPNDVQMHPSFTSLAIKVFEDIQDLEFPRNLGEQPIIHFVDLTKALFLPSYRKPLSPHEINDLARSADHLYTVSQLNEAGMKFKVRSCKCLLHLTRHFADFAKAFFLSLSRKLLVLPDESNDLSSADYLYSASQLYKAGVKFKVCSSKYLLDLKFTNGTLEIPCINLHNWTETTYRNILAFEQYHYPHDSHFTDYIVLLTFLINTPKDEDLLVRKGIIINWLANSKSVASFINNLGTNIAYDGRKSAYRGLFRDLNTFYNSWKASLKRNYFSTLWKISSTAAASIVLLLTLGQFICSIIQLVNM